MSEAKTYTEEQVVRRERDAFEAGAAWRADRFFNSMATGTAHYAEESRRRYPLTRTVPRVVTDRYGVGWKFEDGTFWRRNRSDLRWQDAHAVAVDTERVRLWADLLANPTMEEAA